MTDYRLDDFDRQILAELAGNARLSNMDLAKRLPLSHSAISRRVSRLEREGAIRGYGAHIDPAALGVTIRVFVGVRRDPAASVEELSRGLRAIPQVSGCWIVTGEHDFFLDVRAQGMEDFSDVILKHVAKVPGVLSTVSTFVLADLRAEKAPARTLTSNELANQAQRKQRDVGFSRSDPIDP
jgi:Lrp/AsnC family transcriptional regulator, leucine-responsive regulatory protein